MNVLGARNDSTADAAWEGSRGLTGRRKRDNSNFY